MRKQLLLFITALSFFISGAVHGQGTWSTVTNAAPYGSGGLMLLLSDGTVMAKSNAGGGSGTVWMKLTPNAQGSYVNGTWSQLASMISDRLYFSSQILKDGRVYVAGGEYGAGQNLGEIYNPVANTWTALPNTGHTFSDANSEILPDGKVLQALVEGSLTSTLIYDPATNQYTNGPSTHGIIDESAWVKLKDNSILMVDRDTRNSERYIPSLNQWVVDATAPVDIYDPYGSEAGAAFVLPDGRAFFIGATGSTAYYNPSGNNNPGSWTTGPAIPNGLGAPDAAAAMMVNGKILCVFSPAPTSANHFPSPTYFYEFNYLNNSFTQIGSPDGGNYATFITNMLDLPDGTVLYSTQGSSQYYVYNPGGTPLSAGKPTISQITANDCAGSSYTITGTLFNGISEGAGYGDDWQMATNYPIIRLTNGSNVYYARTYNWNNTGVQTGNTQTTTQFTLPAGLPHATYSLVVTANGISSDPVNFTPSTCNSTGLVTVFKDCSYGGYSAGLNVGDYTTSQLQSLGVQNNDVSSLKVMEGYKVILYDGDNFTGASVTLTANTSCLVQTGTNWNDITSSIQVRTNGVTNMAGIYFLQNRNSGLYADVWGLGTDDGTNIAQGNFNGGANQQFQFNHLGDGTYQILATHSMKSMDISAISTADGANVQQWTYNGTPNQQFIVFSTGDGFYKLIPKHSGKLVEVAGCSTANDGNIQQWTNNNQTCGHWKFVAPVAVNGTGDDLTGSYFNGMNFETPRLSRKDGSVNFNWGTGSPDASVNADQFSARWTGQIEPRYSGIYTFYLNTDNGRRLWINNQLIIDKWIDDWGVEYSGTILLEAGQKYDIKLEYFENNGGASCKMEWSSLLQAREVVPQSQLYSNPVPAVSITSPANNSTFNAPATISLASNATDADGISKVDYYNGSTLIASTTSPFTYSWSNVGQGTYTITAIATDAKGAITISTAVNVTVNPSAGIATVFQDCNYGGYAVNLPAGNYTLSQLIALGVRDNDLSSIKVQSGYEVILYADDNFSGNSLIVTADNSCLVNNSFNDITTSVKVSLIPSSTTIQAENYSNMSGVQTETTSDTGGGLDVGWIDAGDWMAYFNINFPTSGNYTIQYRVASPSGGTLSCDLNAGSIQLGAINIPATGGWQNWTTITQTVSVTAGTYNFGIFAQTGGWNINWFTITQSPSAAKFTSSVSNLMDDSFEFYPNPANATLYIRSSQDMSGGQAKVFDALGVEVISVVVDSDAIDVSSLKSGIYTMVISKYGTKVTRRFVKQ